MSDPLVRLRGAVGQVADTAGTDAASARRLWSTYVREHWTRDVPDLADSLTDAVAALTPLGIAGEPGDGWAGRAKDMQRQLRDAAKDRRGLRLADVDEDAPPIAELLRSMGCPDVPSRYQVPDGYRLDRAGVHRLDDDGERTIARAPIVITGAGEDVDGGRRHLRLAWRLPGGGWASRTVERSRAMQARTLVELAEHGAPVTSVSASAVVLWLDALEAATAMDMPVVRVVPRSGWVDGSTYMLGEEVVGPDPARYTLEPASDGERQWYRSIVRAGTWTGWLGAWEYAVRHPRAAIAVYASVAPALRGVVPSMPGACIEWSGITSGGKSVSMDLAASVWGSMDLVRRWDTTGVGAEVGAAAAYHLPLLLDDTKALLSGGNQRRRDSGASTITATIYLATGSKGRLRGSPTGLREQRDVCTWLLSTSETPSVDLSADVGIRPRTLTMVGRPLGDDPAAGEMAATMIGATIREHHGHLGMRVVAWLAGGGAEQARAWYLEHLQRASSGSAVERRLSQLIASIMLAMDVCEAVGLPRCKGVLDEAIEAARYSVRSADTHAAALRAVWGIGEAQGRIADATRDEQRRPTAGWLGEVALSGEVRLVAATVHDELRRLGHDPGETIDRWRAAGWLALTASGRARSSLRVAGTRGVGAYRLTDAGAAVARDDADG